MLVIGRDHQLLPQPVRMLARELQGQGIDASHALDRDQEGFVTSQSCAGEFTDLVTQMVLELGHVSRDPTVQVTAQVFAPLRDLVFERRAVGEGRSCRARLHPDAAQRVVHDLPLLPLRRELRAARAW